MNMAKPLAGIYSRKGFFQRIFTDKNGVIINESAAKLMGLENPVGEMLRSPEWMGAKSYQILGVVKDMVKDSPFNQPRSLLFFCQKKTMQWLYIRLKPTVSASEALLK
jgi:putative ABC transport system permease protein